MEPKKHKVLQSEQIKLRLSRAILPLKSENDKTAVDLTPAQAKLPAESCIQEALIYSYKVVVMKVHYLMHVPFEGLGGMESWFVSQGWAVSRTRLYAHERLPDPKDLDWLVIMGGPMGVYDEAEFPWLVGEKRFIEAGLARDIPVLGICLGAQLIADVLGAKVSRNHHKEIGWFPVSLTESGRQSPMVRGFPDQFTAFHWHGDVFQTPDGAKSLAMSEACKNQIFARDKVLGLQFHLETLPANAMDLCIYCKDELKAAPYVQPAETILSGTTYFREINHLMRQLLNNMAALVRNE